MTVTIYRQIQRHFEIDPGELSVVDLAELVSGFISLYHFGGIADEGRREKTARSLVEELIKDHPKEAALIKAELMKWEQDQ